MGRDARAAMGMAILVAATACGCTGGGAAQVGVTRTTSSATPAAGATPAATTPTGEAPATVDVTTPPPATTVPRAEVTVPARPTSAPTPAGDVGSVDRTLRGDQFGRATAMSRRSGAWVLTFDKSYLCFTDSKTNEKACGPNRPDTPDGYWIVDESHRLRSVPVSDSASVQLVADDANAVPGTLDQLAGKIGPDSRVLLHLRADGSGTVVSVREQFVP